VVCNGEYISCLLTRSMSMPKPSEIIKLLQDYIEVNGDTEHFGIGIVVGGEVKRGIYSYDGFQVSRDVNYANGMTLLVGTQSNE